MYDENCLLHIGSNIKLMLLACGISQMKLAQQVGISQTHLSNVERDRALLSLKLLLRTANILGCQLEHLLNTDAAVEWVGHKTTGNKGEQCYSLEEVQLLLQTLRFSRKLT